MLRPLHFDTRMLAEQGDFATMPEDDNQDQKARYEAARAMNERVFQAKERMRKRLAALSFDKKINILEKLRDRELMIARARWKRNER